MVDTSTYRNFWSGSNQQRLMCSNGTHSQRDLRNFCVAGWVQVCITDHTSKGHLGHVPYRLRRRIGHAIYRAFLSSLTSCVEFVERLKLRQPNELLHYGLTKCLFTFALKILCLYIIRCQQQPKPQFIKYNQFERRSLMHAELLDARVRCMFWFAIITEVQCIQENTVCSQSVSQSQSEYYVIMKWKLNQIVINCILFYQQQENTMITHFCDIIIDLIGLDLLNLILV
ncbi:Hypothetical_protein [Hexamita inflata]|uniref:Hypothetical_protein n=1 Tax=Hexamita inflata TaxID=28002 RepID=A0AA86R9V3_9EUKA|nr:Hypothetical protein HINF_LOCUS49453 [Hexamita inflata]CAI9973410.1 Hypothetical protein HINF_LOCUS61055 [Hexamita inflata]